VWKWGLTPFTALTMENVNMNCKNISDMGRIPPKRENHQQIDTLFPCQAAYIIVWQLIRGNSYLMYRQMCWGHVTSHDDVHSNHSKNLWDQGKTKADAIQRPFWTKLNLHISVRCFQSGFPAQETSSKDLLSKKGSIGKTFRILWENLKRLTPYFD